VPDSTGTYAYTLESESDNLDSQVDFLVLHQGVDIEHISVIGYGEGGAVAAYSANENPYISSVVFMATPAIRVFPDLTVQQEQDKLARGQSNEIEVELAQHLAASALILLNTYQGDRLVLFGHNLYLGYMRSFASFDIRTMLTQMHQPALVVQGGKDEVVNPGQAAELMSSLGQRPGGVQELKFYPALGHGFGPLIGEAASKPVRSHYLVDARVRADVATWLSKH
jgi:predicted esterase